MSNDILSKNYKAGAGVTKYRIAKHGAADYEALLAAASTDALMGVFTELDQDSGGRVDVYRAGLADVEYGGAVKRGDMLTSDASGRAVSLSADISAITKANPGAVTATAHGFASGDRVVISGVAGMTQVNGVVYTITVSDADTFTIGVDSSGFGTYTSGGRATKIAAAAGALRTIGEAEVSGVLGDIGSVLIAPGLIRG